MDFQPRRVCSRLATCICFILGSNEFDHGDAECLSELMQRHSCRVAPSTLEIADVLLTKARFFCDLAQARSLALASPRTFCLVETRLARHIEPMAGKAQHTVQRFHIAQFVGHAPKGHVWIYDNRSDKPRSAIPDNVSIENNFYSFERDDGTWDNRLDDWITNVEGKATPVYMKLPRRQHPALLTGQVRLRAVPRAYLCAHQDNASYVSGDHWADDAG